MSASLGLKVWDGTMKRKQSSQMRRQALCSELGPEDGIDPRNLLRETARKKGGRKTLQLCGQVAEALNYAFAAICNDDVLRELGVLAVQPAPNESRLLVTVGPMLPGPCDPTQILAHVQQTLGKLRSEVAAAIHRKKVPELAFCVIGNTTERPEGTTE
jgi:ribosome-binding factor A